MYIYLTRTTKKIVESGLKTLNLEPEKYIEVIKEEECIKTDDLIELIENLNYRVEYLEEKMEDIKNGEKENI